MQKSGAQKFLEAFGYFMMLMLVLLGVGLVWLGGTEYSLWSRFPKPETISLEDILRERPGSGWYRITGAALDLRTVAWEEQMDTNTITRVFVPLRSLRNPADRKIHVLVDTKSPDIIAVVQQKQSGGMKAGGTFPPPSGFAAGMFGQANTWLARPVEGTISISGQGGVIASRLKSANIELQNELEPGYIYLNEGKQPSVGAAAGFIIMGLVLIAVILLGVVKTVRDSRAIRIG